MYLSMPLSQHKTAPVKMGGSVQINPYVLGYAPAIISRHKTAPVKAGKVSFIRVNLMYLGGERVSSCNYLKLST